MLRLAQKIVDGLLDPNPDDMESFVQGAITSEFNHFMPERSGKSSSWPEGIEGETFVTRVDSDDGMVRVTVQVAVDRVVGMSNPKKGTTNIRFFVTTKLKRWEGHFRNWDTQLKDLTPDEVSQAAQLTYMWLNGPVPAIINNRPDNIEAEKQIPGRLEFQLKRALHPLRKGEPYEPPIE